MGLFGYGTITLEQVFFSLVLGGLVGALFSDRAKPFRKYLWYALGAVIVLGAMKLPYPGPAMMIFWLVGAVVAYRLLKGPKGPAGPRSTTYGSAQWADLAHLRENGLIEPIQVVKVRHG